MIPSIEMTKTRNKLSGNNKAPTITKGVLGIRKNPLTKEINM
ncbi:hypothetical protein T190820D02B_80077 [Tenacibaculum sp. 190524A05c]